VLVLRRHASHKIPECKTARITIFVHRCLWSEKGHWEFRYRRKTTRKIADIVKTYQVIKRVLEKHDFLMEFMIPPATAEIPFTKLQHRIRLSKQTL
jgi:hypothetical protein